ncbi:MAG: phosphate acyltransferase PlsX [Kiritimatiellae bacterium]|nr:phosphate acyltransferase PlsX [Kiritimatiellia bacterium]
MRIAVDAMGGDFAPREVVAGALQAVRDVPGIERLLLVGREDAIRAVWPKGVPVESPIELVHASEVVDMGDSPATAVRRKRDSSISRAVDLVKQGQADAFFSAGSTGAAVAAAQLKLRTLPGIARPAIATVMPGPRTPWVLLDAGATTDCSAELLFQFAVMGTVYAHEILHIPEPTVGLMSIGGEDSKGNEITKEAFALLKESRLNFRGNIEGHDLFSGEVDVVVCDGFVGNVVLKTSESVAHFIGGRLKAELTRNPVRTLGALLVKPGLNAIRHQSDPANYGGAPLLGVNGMAIIGHGGSNARAVFNGIRVAAEAIAHGVNRRIMDGVAVRGAA